VYKDNKGFGRLTAFEGNTGRILFVWIDIIDIFAIRESRIDNGNYEEA
jgi:hypothetical protein